MYGSRSFGPGYVCMRVWQAGIDPHIHMQRSNHVSQAFNDMAVSDHSFPGVVFTVLDKETRVFLERKADDSIMY